MLRTYFSSNLGGNQSVLLESSFFIGEISLEEAKMNISRE